MPPAALHASNPSSPSPLSFYEYILKQDKAEEAEEEEQEEEEGGGRVIHAPSIDSSQGSLVSSSLSTSAAAAASHHTAARLLRKGTLWKRGQVGWVGGWVGGESSFFFPFYSSDPPTYL